MSSKPQGESPQPQGFMGQQVQINALEVLKENHGHQVPGAQYHISLLQTDDHVGETRYKLLRLLTGLHRQVSVKEAKKSEAFELITAFYYFCSMEFVYFKQYLSVCME